MKIVVNLVKCVAVLVPVITFLTSYNLRMDENRFEPHIYTVMGGKVLVAKIKGDPDITIDTAGVTLYSAGRKLKLSPSYVSARHTTWNQMYTTPRLEWVVYYSRMIPETAITLADIQDVADVSIFFDRREKTKIAEILHIGRYDSIPESLEKLQSFVDKEGYRLSGFYEEIYRVFEHIEEDPDKYETLLRYQVIKNLDHSDLTIEHKGT